MCNWQKALKPLKLGPMHVSANSGLAPLQCSAQQNPLGDLHQQKVGERRYRQEEEVDRRQWRESQVFDNGCKRKNGSYQNNARLR